MSIYESLSKFHSNVGGLRKDSTNPHFKNKYADIDTVLDLIREPLKNAGLIFIQLPQQDGLKTILATVDGKEQLESFTPFILDKNDMQGLGSAITYARRYSLVAMLGLEADDDDGNGTQKPTEQSKITKEQIAEIEQLITKTNSDRDAFMAYFKAPSMSEIPYDKAKQALLAKRLNNETRD